MINAESRHGGYALHPAASKLVLPARLQCFDLTVAHELNAMGNELRARARELHWNRRNATRAALDT
jgi:hypothetical protein